MHITVLTVSLHRKNTNVGKSDPSNMHIHILGRVSCEKIYIEEFKLTRAITAASTTLGTQWPVRQQGTYNN